MKLLLIRPPFSVEKFYFPRPINEPLGIEYLTAFLRQYHDVEMLDAIAWGWNQYWQDSRADDIIFQGINPTKIIEQIEKIKPDIIGLTWLFSTQDRPIRLLIEKIKTYDRTLKIIVGGPEPSADPIVILNENPLIDAVAYGESEFTMKEIMDGRVWADIKGLVWRDNVEIKKNPPRGLIGDLDILPLPFRDERTYHNYSKQYFYQALYLKLEKLKFSHQQKNFLAAKIGYLPYLYRLYYYLFNCRNIERLPFADIITSRGCPNRCSFCAVHHIWGRGCRMRSADNVLTEIELLVSRFGIKHVNFQDDNFNVNKERTIDICSGIVENKYNITISAPAGAFVPTLDEEVLVWLKKAGFNILRMSIESGNQDILTRVIHKNIDLSKVKSVVDICKKIGIRTEGAFIFGIPGETIETMRESLNFAKNAGFDRIVKFIFQPFPNTELYDICVKNNYLTSDYDPKKAYITGDKCFVQTEKFTQEDVYKIARSY
jgi:anaerobic magnesium-protoporphyrin IX monomethyl ester cyclase